MFRVPIAHLSDGLHAEAFTPSAEEVGLDPDVFSDLAVELRLDVRDRRVLAAFEARATARLECDRTLEMYDQPIAGEHTVLFVPPGSPSLDAEDPDEDVLPLPADATELDLTAPVHDTLRLAVPLRRVSPAAEALEIETQFGADGEADRDTRWDALRALDTGDDAPGSAGAPTTD